MRLDERWSPEPDLLVVLDARRHLMMPKRLEGPADFVIEIASEGDPRLDVREKLPRYREAGLPEIWLIDPFTKKLHVEWKTDAGYQALDLSSGRCESRVVAGFWIEVDWLWQEPLQSTLACLRAILS
jgi:Uma2 family endonuclease